MAAIVEPLETVARSLDRLSGAFVSTILSLDQHDTGRVVDGMLQQIAEALAVDHARFESLWRDELDQARLDDHAGHGDDRVRRRGGPTSGRALRGP
jgi:hypothetical protein